MIQQGQVFKLESLARDGRERWAYRYRAGGRVSKRIQRGGFASEQDAQAALERELEKLRRRNGSARTLTSILGQIVALRFSGAGSGSAAGGRRAR